MVSKDNYGYSTRNFEILGMGSLRAEGQCRGLKVVPLCTSYSLVQTLLLQDVSFSHTAAA